MTLRTVDPSTAGWYPPCLLHRLTGFECPGCGSSRAANRLLHGDLLGALNFNALFVVAVPAMVWWYVRWLTGRRQIGNVSLVRVSVALGLVTAVFTLVRNLDAEPFAWLAANA